MAGDAGMTLLLPPVAGGMPTLDIAHNVDALTLMKALPASWAAITSAATSVLSTRE